MCASVAQTIFLAWPVEASADLTTGTGIGFLGGGKWLYKGEVVSSEVIKEEGLVAIDVGDTGNYTLQNRWGQEHLTTSVKDIMVKIKNWATKGAGSKALQGAVGHAMNKIAYDAATWIGSGKEGQKPMFFTSDWEQYMWNIGDEAAGELIEDLSTKVWKDFSLCEPDFNVKGKIMLGLVASERPGAPDCKYSEMKENWDEALDSENFLEDFQDYFNPESNDLGIALSVNQIKEEYKKEKLEAKSKERTVNNGWLSIKNIDDKIISVPGYAKDSKIRAQIANWLPFLKDYDDEFVEAANVFLNQLAIAGFNRLMAGIGKDDTSYTPWEYNLEDYESLGPSSGIASTKEYLSEITQPSFTDRVDYEILGELSMCLDPTNPGPTECVIEEDMRTAIAEEMTVGEAVGGTGFKKDIALLKPDRVFGFDTGGEPRYNEGYPYRSMIILRKFRILPVGWEVAAEYIYNNFTQFNSTISLSDMVACYANDDDYKGYYHNWCKGLVDPSWVLKAPKNYCKREGPGPQIMMDSTVNEKRSISRNDNYCADEQTCIKELDDGSCDNLYGYCTEERRTWRFDAESCEPVHNTCQTFVKTGDGNRTASYLKNSLDYCEASQAGCKQYATMCYQYIAQGDICKWDNEEDKIYLNNKVEECDEQAQGCHALIRTKPGLSVNLIKPGTTFISGTTNNIAAGPDGYSVGGETFIISFSANCASDDIFKIENQPNFDPVNLPEGFYSNQIEYTFPDESFDNIVSFTIGTSTPPNNCDISQVKLERAELAQESSYYSGYGDSVIYEKLLPDYLENTCYELTGSKYFSFKDDLTAEEERVCSGFARKCNIDEAGCELYTSQNQSISLPAQVSAQDYCPQECVGYDTYVSQPTNFSPLGDAYFIPNTSQSCTAIGCEEFTNLDQVAMGGEGLEYYTYLRQCIKPDSIDPVPNCQTFYTWEQGATGPQLRTYTLNATSTAASGPAPALTDYASGDCEDIYNLPFTDNSDCLEFYNIQGSKFYRLYSKTITCSDDCHAYRQKEINIDENSQDRDACESTNNNWDLANNRCVICKNGAKWNDLQGSCIYKAIPGQGMSCEAQEARCLEYTGNIGANVMYLFNNNFDNATTTPWHATGTSAIIEVSPVNIRDGKSMLVKGGDIYRDVASVRFEENYVLSFLIKPESAYLDLDIYFDDGTGTTSKFTGFPDTLRTEWQIVKLNLSSLDHIVTENEKLYFIASSSDDKLDYYIDDIELSVVNDRYYVVKDSWNTPPSCDQDTYGNPFKGFALGCGEYYDRDNRAHYLHSFSGLCHESAIGCELMIDTNNTFSTTSDDDFVFAVYDKEKECGAKDKGCQRLGQYMEKLDGYVYENMYLKNDPDQSDILCNADGVGCEAWTYDGVLTHFKDPGERVCAWKQQPQGGMRWLTDNNELCDVDDLRTIGLGGLGNYVEQPATSTGFAGICPAHASGCTEYIDPVSRFNINIVFNPDFSKDIDNDGTPDGWSASSSGMQDNIHLQGDTLYRVARLTGTGSTTLDCGLELYYLDSDNSLKDAGDTIDIGPGQSKLILTRNNKICSIAINGTMNGEVEVKKAIISYRLKQDIHSDNLSDCNGVIDFDEGCVLFNEREQIGSRLSNLTIDADKSSESPLSCEDINCNANTTDPIKVSPNRVCGKWLACRSKVEVEYLDGKKETVCTDVGLCDRVDDKGECDNFIQSKQETQTKYSNIDNMSGYSKVGYSSEGELRNDFYPFAAMTQVGEVAIVPNGDFESYTQEGYPIGWSWENQEDAGSNWESNIFKVISNPVIASRIEKIGYAPTGNGFLKIGAAYEAISEDIDVEPDTNYTLTAYINTKHLQSGSARIDILGTSAYIQKSLGQQWKFELTNFTTGPNVSKIKIKLHAMGAKPEGNFYFDDIRLRPSLKARNNWNVQQSCRLYPEEDSPSCDYFDDSGTRKKGIYGYCLEYDRAPGDTKSCLLWYPIDRVNGDGVEEGKRYSNLFPLYYCTEAIAYCSERGKKYLCNEFVQVVTPTGKNKYWSQRVSEGSDYELPFANSISQGNINWGSAGGEKAVVLSYTQSGVPFGSMRPPSPVYNPYEWDAIPNKEYLVENDALMIIHYPSDKTIANAGIAFYGQDTTCKAKKLESINCPGGKGSRDCFSKPLKDIGEWESCKLSDVTYDGTAAQEIAAAGFVQKKYDEGDYCELRGSAGGSWSLKSFVPGGKGGGGVTSCLAECEDTMSYNIAETKPKGVEGVKRLFAQSYGTWTWATRAKCRGGSNHGNTCPGSGCIAGGCVDVNDIGICKALDDEDETANRGAYCVLGSKGGCKKVDGVYLDNEGLPCCYQGYCAKDSECEGGGRDGMYCADNDQCSGTCSEGKCSNNSSKTCTTNSNNCSGTCDKYENFGICEKTVNSEKEFGELCAANAARVGDGNKYVCDTDFTCATRQGMCLEAYNDIEGCVPTDDSKCPGGECVMERNYILSDNSESGITRTWGPPSNLCPPGGRPVYNSSIPSADYCAIPPVISNIRVNKSSNDIILRATEFATLTFTTDVDAQQMPLVMFSVDWGDGEKTTVTGSEMQDKNNPEFPHLLYHLYSYWDIKEKNISTGVSSCSIDFEGNYCIVKPKIRIRDNWGWCNSGTLIHDCDFWKEFNGTIKVRER